MKNLLSILLFLILPFWLSSQGISKYMIDEYIESEHLDLMKSNGSLAIEKVEVLNPVVTQRLDEEIDYVQDNRSYVHDEQGGRIQYNDYSWAEQNELLYKDYQQDYSFSTRLENFKNNIQLGTTHFPDNATKAKLWTCDHMSKVIRRRKVQDVT